MHKSLLPSGFLIGYCKIMIKTPLSKDHQEFITEKLDAIGMHLSEFSFPNLYLFRNTHQYETIETDHGFFISGITYDKKRYLMPMTSPEKAGEDCFMELKELLQSREWDFLFPIPEGWLECFDEKEFIRTSSPDDTDYLFLTEKFKTYPGKKMHKKKNLLNQFLKSHEALLIPITSDVVDDAIGILDHWQNNSSQEMAVSDYQQCREGLEMCEELGLVGALAFADDRPAGFLLGEDLNNDTFTIHFAKADVSFKGIYQFLFSRFACDFCSEYKYMNLEQDLGSEGLRKTKISYRPDLMAHKYRITMK
jgi:hypothetical protein